MQPHGAVQNVSGGHLQDGGARRDFRPGPGRLRTGHHQQVHHPQRSGTLASIVATGTGITINAGANDVVVVRNIQINGIGASTGAGIRLASFGTQVVVENVVVQGFDKGIHTTAATTDAAIGIVSVMNSTITDNHGIGVHAEGGTISVLDSRLISNNIAVQADPLGTIRLSNNDVMNNKTG